MIYFLSQVVSQKTSSDGVNLYIFCDQEVEKVTLFDIEGKEYEAICKEADGWNWSDLNQSTDAKCYELNIRKMNETDSVVDYSKFEMAHSVVSLDAVSHRLIIGKSEKGNDSTDKNILNMENYCGTLHIGDKNTKMIVVCSDGLSLMKLINMIESIEYLNLYKDISSSMNTFLHDFMCLSKFRNNFKCYDKLTQLVITILIHFEMQKANILAHRSYYSTKPEVVNVFHENILSYISDQFYTNVINFKSRCKKEFKWRPELLNLCKGLIDSCTTTLDAILVRFTSLKKLYSERRTGQLDKIAGLLPKIELERVVIRQDKEMCKTLQSYLTVLGNSSYYKALCLTEKYLSDELSKDSCSQEVFTNLKSLLRPEMETIENYLISSLSINNFLETKLKRDFVDIMEDKILKELTLDDCSKELQSILLYFSDVIASSECAPHENQDVIDYQYELRKAYKNLITNCTSCIRKIKLMNNGEGSVKISSLLETVVSDSQVVSAQGLRYFFVATMGFAQRLRVIMSSSYSV